MTLRELISPFFARWLTGDRRRDALRAKAEERRCKAGAPHRVVYFHQVDDPYAALTAQILGAFAARYDIELCPLLVPPPAGNDAPEREALAAYSRKDAALLAARYGLLFEDRGHPPHAALIARANAVLAGALKKGTFLHLVERVSDALWREDEAALNALADAEGEAAGKEVAHVLEEGRATRARMGHYLGAVFVYEGEQYWGIDRLHHLEARLSALGVKREGAPEEALCPPPPLFNGHADVRPGPPIDFFLSLRSPYTYVAAAQLFELAQHYNCEVRLRFVLPMMMRGIPASPQKLRYITLDAKREAARAGLPFGHIADPFGRPAERGLSLIPYAMEAGCGQTYVLSFLSGVWAEGIRAGTDKGLKKIAVRAGLDWREARARLRDESWRRTAEVNRQALFAHGLWGVPTFAVGECAVWGQDRLWAVEDEILRIKGRVPCGTRGRA